STHRIHCHLCRIYYYGGISLAMSLFHPLSLHCKADLHNVLSITPAIIRAGSQDISTPIMSLGCFLVSHGQTFVLLREFKGPRRESQDATCQHCRVGITESLHVLPVYSYRYCRAIRTNSG